MSKSEYIRFVHMPPGTRLRLRACVRVPMSCIDLEGLAGVAVAQDQAERAARLCGTAAALRTLIGAPVSPPERARSDRHVSAARAALGDAGFAAAWAAGQTEAQEYVMASNG